MLTMAGKLPESEITSLHVEQRIEIANDWLDAAEAVAKKTRHPDAKLLLEYADQNVAIGVPIANGVLDIYLGEPDKDIDYFYITPILPIDKSRLDADDKRLDFLSENPPAVARFNEVSRAVYLSPVTLSRLGRGLVLLHELQHAIRHPGPSTPTEDERHVQLEEADVLAFEFDLMETLLGKTYQKNLRSCIEKGLTDRETIDSSYLERRFEKKLKATAADMNFWLGMHTLNARWRYLEQLAQNPREAFAIFLDEQKITGSEN